MVPLNLTLRNFLSYRGTVTIDFEGLTVACLSGENGAGKSALLDAMTWAIWGKSRAQRDVELISLGEEEMEVSLVFRMGSRSYRIMRRRTRTRPTLEFDTRPSGSDSWLPIGGDSIRDTEARIVQELRLDHETFVNSALLQQGEADRFTQNPPRDRKRILGEILDLSIYDDLATEARGEARRGREAMDRLQDRIGRIDLALANRHEIEVAAAETDELIGESDQRLEVLQAEIEALQARLNAAELTEGMVARNSARLVRLDTQIVEARRRRQDAAGEIEALNTIISREQAIRAAVAEARKWRSIADNFAAALTARQPIQQRIGELRTQIQQAESALNHQTAMTRRSITTLETRIEDAESNSKTLQRCNEEIEVLEPQIVVLPSKTEALNSMQDQMAVLNGENSSLKARMEDIQARIASLSSGDATCPVCRRPLEDGEHAHIHADWTVEGKQLGNAYRANRDKIAKLKVEIENHRREIERLGEASRKLAGITAQATNLRGQVAELPALIEALQKEQSELRRLEQTLEKHDYVQSERAELAQLQKDLDNIPYDADDHTNAVQELERLSTAESDLADFERAAADSRALAERVSDLDMQLKALDQERQEVDSELRELRKSLEGIDEVRAMHARKLTEHQSESQNRRALEQRSGSLRRQLADLDEQASEKASLEKEASELSSQIDAYRELTIAFGRDGIQAMIIENVLPELEDETNRLLSRMTSKQLEVQFRTTREAVSSDSTIETLDILISDESGRRPYQLFSGGEAFRINFAIRVALAKLLARRAGASVETLIIDEGFGTQDQQGRDGLIEALQSVSGDFDLILAITHIDELRDQFPNRIEIVKTVEGSRATLV